MTRYLPVNVVILLFFPISFFFFFFAGDKCCVAVNWKRKKWWNNQHQTRQWSNTVLWYVIKIRWNLDKPHYSKQILTVPWAFVIWRFHCTIELQKSRPIIYVCRDVAKSQLPATCNFTGWIELITASNCSRKSNTWVILRVKLEKNPAWHIKKPA